MACLEKLFGTSERPQRGVAHHPVADAGCKPALRGRSHAGLGTDGLETGPPAEAGAPAAPESNSPTARPRAAFTG